MELPLPDEAAAARLGRAIAAGLRRGDAVCLSGPLGAGKSTVARAAVRALTSPDEDVPSPTFTLVQTYQGPDFPVAHFDLYRLRSADEALELGLDDAISDGAALIEWPERLDRPPSLDRLDIELQPWGPNGAWGRQALIVSHGSWRERELRYEP
jgi:tRNA threonylcarbamoyladenosine biosynthesis protein TsaE